MRNIPIAVFIGEIEKNEKFDLIFHSSGTSFVTRIVEINKELSDLTTALFYITQSMYLVGKFNRENE